MRKNIACPHCQRAWEQELAETLLRVACPQCGVVLDLTRAAEAQPGLSAQDRALIGLAGGIAIGLLLIKIGGNRKRK